MTYEEFLARVINEGIEAAKADYSKESDKLKLEGALAGFEACKGKSPDGLGELRIATFKATQEAFRTQVRDYWHIRCYQAEVEWVCNVVSAMLNAEGLAMITYPTAKGIMKAADILGVKEEMKND